MRKIREDEAVVPASGRKLTQDPAPIEGAALSASREKCASTSRFLRRMIATCSEHNFRRRADVEKPIVGKAYMSLFCAVMPQPRA
jgi:hypothetical protein